MKPKDLKLPFEENNRRSFIYDRILRVPKLDEKSFVFPGWEHPDLFGNGNDIHIEYCSGNGGWIAAKAAANPLQNWVAVEMKFSRTRKIWSKIKKENLENLFVVNGEGFHTTSNYFPNSSTHKIFINFPDPWPKRRHAKNRIVQTKFVDELARILVPGGSVTFVTDDPGFSEWAINVFENSNIFVSHYPAPFYSSDQEEYGTSFFDSLWREMGKTIRYHQYIRQ